MAKRGGVHQTSTDVLASKRTFSGNEVSSSVMNFDNSLKLKLLDVVVFVLKDIKVLRGRLFQHVAEFGKIASTRELCLKITLKVSRILL